MTETPEALRARLERWLRDGFTDNETPLDGYGREVVREVMAALSSRPEGDAASALSPDVRERLQALEAEMLREADLLEDLQRDAKLGVSFGFVLKWAYELQDVLAARPSEPPQDGAAMIAAERRRVIASEGWSPEHDDSHSDHELLMAAYSYIQKAWTDVPMLRPPSSWPWEPAWWKPSPDPIRNLVKAGQLVAAEIDRVLRKADPPAVTGGSHATGAEG